MILNKLVNLNDRTVIGILLGVAIFSSVGSAVVNAAFHVDTSPSWWVSWLQNFSTEMFGAFLTFILIELVVGGRKERVAEERTLNREKVNLIQSLRTGNKRTVKVTLERLRENGWLTDGSLRGASLVGADLKQVDLNRADLQGCILRNSDLQEAILTEANLPFIDLEGANLKGANLRAAKLYGVNLYRTILDYADMSAANLGLISFYDASLSGANLTNTDLKGKLLVDSDLTGTILKGADLEGAKLGVYDSRFPELLPPLMDEDTVLPDGSNWTSETDMARFTDPKHPNFWRSDDLQSPAYHSKENLK
jgi:uncharacterized protein YjbI with pentapeptide repeats